MSLFQPSVLKKYLSQQDSALIQKAYKKYVKYFHNAAIQENIRNSKEEQFQEGFLRELFVDILGYTLNPAANFNLTTELKNIKGAKKVDGAILKDGNALGVIELKGTNTKDLESIRQQAFDYKANQTGCIYVITSNFEKLRFYINNAVDFEEFNLFTLTHSEFEIFYLCLAKENILANKPLSIKEASVVEEENITKKFYGDYSVFKRELYRDLVKQNRSNILLNDLPEKTTKLILFQKSQKLIDRFLFILFAEDRGLLAPNSINTVLKEWKALADLDVEMPLYDRYKQYFGYLDTGRKGTDKKEEIFAYNGGLFQPDAILDAIIIDNDLLYRHTLKLSTYDFESQVDVNILGHIFEHSLNEIESVNAEIEGTDFDKQKTKRKKDGVFYTPKYITKYIVDNTIGKFCTDKKQELGIIDEEYAKGRKNRQTTTIIKLDQQLKDYREWLLELTICDPACGSGAFLNQALDFLIREHAYLDELNKQLFGGFFVFPDIENQILEHNIYGVDLNEESIEIAKLSLWLRTAQPKRKLTSLNNNIKCGNSLIESKAVAGDKAFNWKEQFPEVFAKGGFDVVIGNPPYVQSHALDEGSKEYIYKKYLTAEYQINTYAVFTEKIINIIKQKGIYSIIIPNYWLSTKYDSKLRTLVFLLNNCLEIVNVFRVFEDATVDTLILTGKKGNAEEFPKKTHIYSIDKSLDSIEKRLTALDGRIWSFKELIEFENLNSEINLSFDKKLNLNGKKVIGDFLNGYKGMQPYEKGKGTPLQTREMMDARIYHSEIKLDETYFQLIGSGNVQLYNLKIENSFIKYGKNLASPRRFEIFTRPRILVNRIFSKKTIDATYVEEVIINNTDVFNFIPKDEHLKYLKPILAILTTNVCSVYFKTSNVNLNRQAFPKLNVNNILEFPLPDKLSDETLNYLSKNVDTILSLNKDLQGVNRKFSNYFSGQYKLEKLPRKLENWSELTFSDFITELNKAIKKTVQTPLTKKDEFEWLDLFEENKTKAQNLKSQIETTEKAIDKMVYELYGLSEEEINIVENS
ncbi:restriction endonuclease subunit M [Flavobacterium sp. RSP49]|uniref:Eco57I restriction-modification methylase domain-containing protein n=1 Tax=Flavobacterium sp. RSP49 TaxID=2497487 RepID=UPI000F8364FA|nr:N-6 DNA methylase [Flavobacterium sp. RSP49]RTZ01322.1 restriction endonuclease subunit M [Flavobacterium sp. RSP49]